MRGLSRSMRPHISLRFSGSSGSRIPQVQATSPARGISTSSSITPRIRHGIFIPSNGLHGSIRPSLIRQNTYLQVRSFSLLPASLQPSLPEVVEETQTSTPSGTGIGPEIATNAVSATDEALVPVSTIFDPIINPLSNFLIELPHPFGYGTSIIILTLLIRTIFTLPVSLWQRKRVEKTKKLVEPELRVINEQLAKSIARDFRRRGIGYNEYLLEVRTQVAKAQRELHNKHSTHPFITTWSPLLLHIPIFVTLSLTIRRTLEIPSSPFFNESFLWLDKLGEIDSYGVLPLVGSLLSFGNAELVGRKRSQEKIKVDQVDSQSIINQVNKENVLPIQAQNKPAIKPKASGPPPPASGLFSNKQNATPNKSSSSSKARKISTSTIDLAQHRPPRPSIPTNTTRLKGTNPLVDLQVSEKAGELPFSPARQAEVRRNFMAGILRFSALGFGLIASQMPAGVTLYWVTSIGFSFVQNLVLSWLPQRKAERERARKAAEATSRSSTV